MLVSIDITQLAERDQFQILCFLKSKFEQRRFILLDQKIDEHYNYLASRTVAFLKAKKVERVKELLMFNQKDLVKDPLCSRSVMEDLERFLSAYGWALSK